MKAHHLVVIALFLLGVWSCANVTPGACQNNSDCEEENEVCLSSGVCGVPTAGIPSGYCGACQNDSQCVNELGEGAQCITIGDGSFCGIGCENTDCPDPESMVCVVILDDQDVSQGKQCVPRSGDCSCTPLTPDTVKPCTNANKFGACFGESFCDPTQGFLDCDAPAAGVEVCDGIDNDCDGTPDDDPVDVGVNCGSDLGVCEPGVLACIDGNPVCEGGVGGSPESCDGVDNDCDGVTDDDPFEVGEDCGIDIGTCEFGSKICSDGGIICQGGQGPGVEICDDLDNDCDGSTDEIEDVGFISCGFGVCENISSVCDECIPVNNASDEQCNLLDDDCDGSVDEELGTTTCGLGICEVSIFNCIDGNTQTCIPGDPQPVDFPDTTFEDSNCDGIDGEIDNAIFVSLIGVDAPGCGAINTPCFTIQIGINEAVLQSKRDVYVAGGSYANGTFFLANGVNVFGGFGSNFQRDPALANGNQVATVLGSDNVQVLPGEFQGVAMVAIGLTQSTIVADLTLVGPNTTQTLPDGQGKSSHVMIVKDVPSGVLLIERNTLVAGNGALGQNGSNGQNASVVVATNNMRGADGVRGDESSIKQGGLGGANSSCSSTQGGRGGNGGDEDGCGGAFNLNACPGNPGGNGSQAGGIFGGGGSAGPPDGPGGPGEPGKVINGSAGTGGASGGRLIGSFWYAKDGTNGNTGANGGGGGGGGGGGASDVNIDDFGSSGGGGGAGGCSAISAGDAGKGGGGSFAVFLINASPTLIGNTINRGNGAKGGNGGIGGQGQSGGLGGLGGSQFENNGAGGDGGDGGHGGHGGGGGGGSGGVTAAVYATSSSSTPVLTGNTISGGSAGARGNGGQSAPSAPGGDNDGADGQNGSTGGTPEIFDTCQNANAC